MANSDNDNAKNPSSDLTDSGRDLAKMKPEPVTINLPDVKDIPGQENIVPASLDELADLTAASSDEEGDDLFGDDNDLEPGGDPDAIVTATEADDLEEASSNMQTEDDINLRKAALDDTDDEGTLLNEGSSNKNVTGSDLDIPGAEDDDAEEETGEDDEENNAYSLGGDNHDDIPEDNF